MQRLSRLGDAALAKNPATVIHYATLVRQTAFAVDLDPTARRVRAFDAQLDYPRSGVPKSRPAPRKEPEPAACQMLSSFILSGRRPGCSRQG